MNRRTFLASAAAAGTATLAGCGGSVERRESGEDLRERVPAPELGRDERSGWERIESWGEEYDVPVVDAVGHGVRYADRRFRERVAEETLGRVDRDLAQFFAIRVDFFPDVGHLGTAFEDVEATAEAELEARLRDQPHLRNVTRSGVVDTVATHTGREVDLVGYAAEYPVEAIVIEDVSIPDVGERSFEIPARTLDVRGVIGYWKREGSVYIAGGVYPAEDFRASPRVSVSGGEEGEGIDVVVEVNVELADERRRVYDLLRSVR